MGEIDVTVHMVVKNEDRFIWYSVASILPYVKNIFVTDTGSSDRTIEILKSFQVSKIHLETVKIKNPNDISTIRNEHIKKTKTDWFWVIDGDEIYKNDTVREIGKIIKNTYNTFEGIVVNRIDLLGDIYHYQNNSAGIYDLFGKRGHFALRLIHKKMIPGIHIEGIYPYEGYYDRQGTEIIHHLKEKFYFTKGSLFHAMYLKRSSNGSQLSNVFHRHKYKVEDGIKIKNTSVPEIFSSEKPIQIENVTNKRSLKYEIGAKLITPMKKIKRALCRA